LVTNLSPPTTFGAPINSELLRPVSSVNTHLQENDVKILP
jgi:hypothetical protein